MTVNRRDVAFSMMGPQNQPSRCRSISKYVHRLATVATLARAWKTLDDLKHKRLCTVL